MGEGYQIGKDLGESLARGVAEWKQIQLQKKQRQEFDGRMALVAQRRAMIKSAAGIEEAAMIQAFEAQIQRSPDAQQADRPTGNVREDGSPETEQVIRTAEGDISLKQLQMLKQRKRQAESMAELAEVDLILETQAALPDNPFAKQWVAANYLAIQQKKELRAQQIAQGQLQLETERAALEREKFDQELREYQNAPGRAREEKTFETDERIRSDAARIKAEQAKEIAVEGVKAQNKPERPATEFVKKLQQMAPRALESYKVLEKLDVNRPGLGQSAQGLLPNFAKSGERQQFEQAQTEFVTAILRAESGATITEPEVERDIPKYFPVLGDKPEVVAQKRQARQTALLKLYEAAELDAPDLGPADRDPAAGGGWTPEGIRQAMRAGKLTRDQAISMIEKLDAQQ